MERKRGRKRQPKTPAASTSSVSQAPPSGVQSNVPTGVTSHGISARIVIQPAPKSFRHDNISNIVPNAQGRQTQQYLWIELQAFNRRIVVRIKRLKSGCEFRYKCECEGRSAGSIPGVTSSQQSDSDIKTYPTIQVTGHTEPIQIIVSCVTAEEFDNAGRYRPHPHNLVSRNFCVDGYCRKWVQPSETMIPFNFGIQCCKIDEAKESLEVRESKEIDPFRVGFEHKNNVASINMKAVRLCFQIYYQKEKRFYALPPLVSNIVYDSKTLNEFLIREVSQCSGPMDGNTKNILLCNQLGKEHVSLTFFEEQNGTVVWTKDAEIRYVYKGLAIVFEIPKYREHNDYQQGNNAEVFMQLRKNGAESNAVPFEYISHTLSDYIKRKKSKHLNPVLALSPQMAADDIKFTDANVTQANTSSFDIGTPAPHATVPPFQQWQSTLDTSYHQEESLLLNSFQNNQSSIDQPSTSFGTANYDLPFYTEQSASFVEQNPNASFVEQNLNASFVQQNPNASFVDQNLNASFVDQNLNASFVQQNPNASFLDQNLNASFMEQNPNASFVEERANVSLLGQSSSASFFEQNVPPESYIQLPSQTNFGQNLQMPCNVDVSFNDAQEVIDEDFPYNFLDLDLPKPPEEHGTCFDGEVESLSRSLKNNKISH